MFQQITRFFPELASVAAVSACSAFDEVGENRAPDMSEARPLAQQTGLDRRRR